MRIFSTTFWLPKEGNSDEEYEDAALPLEETHEEWSEFRCAIADGATESSFARQWAQLLVQSFVDSRDFAGARACWSEAVTGKSLSWYAEEKLEQGAYAAFAGLILSEEGGWEASTIGDCCIIQVREGSILQAFPLSKAEQFDNRPFLLSSRSSADDEKIEQWSGEWQPQDVFLLITDALAKCCFWLEESEQEGIARLIDLDGEEQFRQFVDESRAARREDGTRQLHNDDLTMVRLIVAD